MIFLSSADFSQNKLFQKIILETLSECQTVWIQIRPDILSSLIWIQTICKDQQQTTKFYLLFRAVSGSPPQLFSTLMILKAACLHNHCYIDRLITTFMKVLTKMAREHLTPTTTDTNSGTVTIFVTSTVTAIFCLI